ncbi:hypothetical protein [Streptomyces sp. NPDC049040]|uniref:hypothetical protein n=1 Tax=Streptomyces sp. NPDC049040 TaxID=3365593 RepID=UPI0037222111
MKIRARIAVVTGITAAGLLVLAPAAEANWTSSITNGSPGFESRRWDDQQYSQVQFTDCVMYDTIAAPESVDVQMWRDISLAPDDSYDNKVFTACFGGGTSNGEWTDLPTNTVSVYFKLHKVGGRDGKGVTWIDVGKVYADTTAAD